MTLSPVSIVGAAPAIEDAYGVSLPGADIPLPSGEPCKAVPVNPGVTVTVMTDPLEGSDTPVPRIVVVMRSSSVPEVSHEDVDGCCESVTVRVSAGVDEDTRTVTVVYLDMPVAAGGVYKSGQSSDSSVQVEETTAEKLLSLSVQVDELEGKKGLTDSSVQVDETVGEKTIESEGVTVTVAIGIEIVLDIVVTTTEGPIGVSESSEVTVTVPTAIETVPDMVVTTTEGPVGVSESSGVTVTVPIALETVPDKVVRTTTGPGAVVSVVTCLILRFLKCQMQFLWARGMVFGAHRGTKGAGTWVCLFFRG
jgi:hypothetical protein